MDHWKSDGDGNDFLFAVHNCSHSIWFAGILFFFTKLEIFVWHLENTLAGILFTIQLACLSFSWFFPITFVMTSPFLRLERFLKVWKV